MQSHLSLFTRRTQWGIISCADDLDLLMTLSLRLSLIVPVTTWCHQCYLITPRAKELDQHKENILKSSWGYTGTDASESNPSRVNCRGLGAKRLSIFSPRVPGRCHRDEMNGLYCQPGMGPHWSRGNDADTWLADADLVLSAVISRDHGRNRRNQSADVMASRVTCHHINNRRK